MLRETDGSSRRLYSDLVPPSNGYAIQVYDETKYGVCADGFFGSACTAEILSLYGVNEGPRNFDGGIAFSIILIALTSSVVSLLL